MELNNRKPSKMVEYFFFLPKQCLCSYLLQFCPAVSHQLKCFVMI